MNNSKRKINLVAIVPFFNERKFIFDLVNETLKYVDLVIAVDDGSTDGSGDLIRNIDNVILISNKVNCGKGFALKKGFEKAIELNAHIIFTLDADNQHKPDIIPEFLKKINESDIVIGNRLHDLRTMPLLRILSNFITSFLLSGKTGIKIKDSQCGFRAYRKDVIENVKTIFNGFEAESEIIVRAARKDFRISFIDIPTIYGQQESKMKAFRTIKGFIKVMLI